MTVEEVKAEVMLLNVDNIQNYPCSSSKKEDFRNLWLRFGPQAGRDIMIPSIWNGDCPRPSEFFNE